VGQREKLVIKILSGTGDDSIRFDELCGLLNSFRFSLRIKGSHNIFYRDDVEEIINIQPKNGKVKPYQVKQIRNIIIEYKLGGELNVQI
jgi:predicted RNA binding protein YcfA (HicA-like mRNA interferase family)